MCRYYIQKMEDSIFIRGDKLKDDEILSLYKLHRKVSGYTDLLDDFKKLSGHVYVLTSLTEFNIYGYIILKLVTTKIIKIEWIYGPGYGVIIMMNIEKRYIDKGFEKILLNCSIDPTEDKNTVMRRINFYIKNKYRVYDIEYRHEHGPSLKMEKILNVYKI